MRKHKQSLEINIEINFSLYFRAERYGIKAVPDSPESQQDVHAGARSAGNDTSEGALTGRPAKVTRVRPPATWAEDVSIACQGKPYEVAMASIVL